MPIEWGGGSIVSRFKLDARKTADRALEEVRSDLNWKTRRGAELVRKVIRTDSQARTTGRSNRIETGDMLRAVTHRTRSTKDGFSASFGWIDYNRSTPLYTPFQEHGTQGGQGNGSGIPAMNALAQAYAQIKAEMRADGYEPQ